MRDGPGQVLYAGVCLDGPSAGHWHRSYSPAILVFPPYWFWAPADYTATAYRYVWEPIYRDGEPTGGGWRFKP